MNKTKTFVIGEAKSKLEAMKRSINKLNEEDKATARAAIEELQKKVEELTAEEDDVDTDTLKKELLTIIDEKFSAMKEKQEFQNPGEVVGSNNYLKSENSLQDFANSIRQSKNATEFRNLWSNHLSENGITINQGGEGGFLPEAVKGIISEANMGSGLIKLLNHTGAKRFYARFETNFPLDAKTWLPGDTKVDKSSSVASKLIEADYIYSLIEVDKKTVWNDDDESFVRYIVNSLTRNLMQSIECAIIVGNSIHTGNALITNFEPLYTATQDFHHCIYNNDLNGTIDDFVNGVVLSRTAGHNRLVLVISPFELAKLRRVQYCDTATPVYRSVEEVAAQIGVDDIVVSASLYGVARGIIFNPDEYYVVGDLMNPEFMMSHQIYTNIDVYREEVCVGGGLGGYMTSIIIPNMPEQEETPVTPNNPSNI